MSFKVRGLLSFKFYELMKNVAQMHLIDSTAQKLHHYSDFQTALLKSEKVVWEESKSNIILPMENKYLNFFLFRNNLYNIANWDLVYN